MSDEQQSSGFVEKVGNGGGVRVDAVKKIIADKKVELQPLADELSDAYQASVALEAGEHFDESCAKALPRYVVLAGYNPKTKEYSLKFAHDFHHMLEYVSDMEGKVDVIKAAAEGYSPGLAHMMTGSCAQYGGPGGDAVTVAPNVTLQRSDDDVIPGENSMSYTQLRSTSLAALLDYANGHMLFSDHQIDVAKYASPSTGTRAPGA